MSAHRHTLPDANAAAEACAHHVISVLEQVLDGQEFATFAVSGGSSPKLMFNRLAATQFRWDHVHIFFVDERCVPPADEQSNYKLANEHLIRPAHIPPHNVHRICGEIPPPRAAARYVDEIAEHFQLQPGGMPRFLA